MTLQGRARGDPHQRRSIRDFAKKNISFVKGTGFRVKDCREKRRWKQDWEFASSRRQAPGHTEGNQDEGESKSTCSKRVHLLGGRGLGSESYGVSK